MLSSNERHLQLSTGIPAAAESTYDEGWNTSNTIDVFNIMDRRRCHISFCFDPGIHE